MWYYVGFLVVMSMLEAQVPLIPRTVLFDNPTKSQIALSPQGTYISYCAPYNGIMNIYIQRRSEYKGFDDPVLITKETVAVQGYFWSFDETKLFFMRDNDGDENTRLFCIDIKSNIVMPLTPAGAKARVSYYDEKQPERMLVSLNQRNPAVFDLYELQLTSKKLTLLEQCPHNGIAWVIDHDGRVRFLYAATDDGGKQLMVRSGNTWIPWVIWNNDDALSSGPWYFSADNSELYCADARECDVAKLVTINCQTQETHVIAYDQEVDVSSCTVQPRTRVLQSVSWTKARDEQQFFDVMYERDYRFACSLDTGDCVVVSRTLDDAHWIVAFEKDAGPVTYYYINKHSWTVFPLGDHRPALRNYTLTPIEPVTYRARDGLQIHGYISYPAQKERKNLPLVLYVHGGPWTRDNWGYNPMVQWFTNRGYICLQVNYRGSLGYGKAFLNAGNKQWSRAMHDDLVDAVQWAIDAGIADAKKIAIYGGSYGGYAALVGATHTPDLFCCAVDIVGPSNLLTFIRSIPPYWRVFLEDMYRRVGNPDTEADFLKACSPLFAINNIKIPLFIAQGANDPRVKQAESEQIVAALRAKNIPHTYMLFHDEGHGFAKPHNRLAFMAAAEQFLAENLGGHCEQ